MFLLDSGLQELKLKSLVIRKQAFRNSLASWWQVLHFLQKILKCSLIIQCTVQETENGNLLLRHTHNLLAAVWGNVCFFVPHSSLHLRGLKTQMCAMAAGAYPEWRSTDVAYQLNLFAPKSCFANCC